ncbi:hypothetical protein D4764_13G0011650 [Takifugu flavidus]|uniref:Reverse transcriptase domain-containing protein n=1 Tax=Takifugu flavidus TaxID=433684 RepID=A0A5C6PAH0_9TELE|nr:hypothetical protein D4764_13G0011650 [Takifugu flavidus]
MRPHYMPREFTHALAVVVYITPSANADAAYDVLLSVVSRLQTQHPDTLLLISGDFDHTSPSSSLPKFTQYVASHTRDNKTLELFYANTKEAHHSLPLPPLGWWSEEAEEVLKDCFNSTLWDAFSDAHGEDIDNLTHCITDYINFCVNTVPTRTVQSFSNSKPWITPDIKALLKEKKRAFVSGNKEELKSAQKELRRQIRHKKDSYRRKMEHQLQQNNICGVWKGLQTILGFKEQKSQPVGNRGWANDQDLFFNGFDQAPTPSPAQSPLLQLDDAIIYHLHSSLTHSEKAGSTCVQHIQPRLLEDKLQHGTVLAPFLFTLYTADFSYNSSSCHLQKFSDNSAAVGLITDRDDGEYRGLIQDFVDWSLRNNLRINTNKTKELVVDFCRLNNPPPAPVNILGTDVEFVKTYKYLGVHLNNNLDWTHNTDTFDKKGNSRLFLLRRLRSFGVQGQLLRTFYDSVVGSAIFYGIVCWSSSIRDRRRMDRLVRRTSSVLGCSLDSVEVVVNGRMMAKLSSMLNNTSL